MSSTYGENASIFCGYFDMPRDGVDAVDVLKGGCSLGV